MKFNALLALVGLYVTAKASHPRSINVALDTVLEFDKFSDVELIDQVQGFLDKVKNTIKENKKQDDYESNIRFKRYKFADFLEDLLIISRSFNDDDLRGIIRAVDDEVRRNMPSNALEENIRKLLKDEINRIKTKPVNKIRKSLDKLLKKIQTGKKNKNSIFIRFINTLYKRNSENKLANFINKLKVYRRSGTKNKNLQGTIRKGIELILFERFTDVVRHVDRKAPTNVLHDKFVNSVNDIKKIHEDMSTQHKQIIEMAIQQSVETKISDIENENVKENINLAELRTSEQTETMESPEVLDDERLTKPTYINDNIPKVRSSKTERRHFKDLLKTKIMDIKEHSKNKLTHVTLYPDNLDIAKQNLRVTNDGMPIKEYKHNIDMSVHDITLAPVHNKEIDISIKYKKLPFISENDDNEVKVGALRKNIMVSHATRSNIDSKDYDFDLNNKEYVEDKFSTQKTLNKLDKENFHNTYKHQVTGYLKQIEYEENISDTVKHTKKSKMTTRKKYKYNSKITKGTAYEKEPRDKYYRLSKGHSIPEKKRDNRLKTIEIPQNFDRLANELNTVENKFDENDKNLQTIELTYNNDRIEYPLNNRGFRRVKYPTSVNISKNYGNDTSMLKTYYDTKITVNKIQNQSSSRKYPNITITSSIPTKIIFKTINVTDSDNIKKIKIVDNLIRTKDISTTAKSRLKLIRQKYNLTKELKSNENILYETSNGNATSAIAMPNKPNVDKGQTLLENGHLRNKWKHIKPGIISDRRHLNSKTTTTLNKEGKANKLEIDNKIKIEANLISSKQLATKANIRSKVIRKSFDHIRDLNSSGTELDKTRSVNANNTKDMPSKPLIDKDSHLENGHLLDKVNKIKTQVSHLSPKTTNTINKEEKPVEKNIDLDPLTELNATETDAVPIVIKKFLQNPKHVDFEDEDKKNKIEQMMKADLENMFTAPPTVATTTAVYTDIFEVIDNVFGIK